MPDLCQGALKKGTLNKALRCKQPGASGCFYGCHNKHRIKTSLETVSQCRKFSGKSTIHNAEMNDNVKFSWSVFGKKVSLENVVRAGAVRIISGQENLG